MELYLLIILMIIGSAIGFYIDIRKKKQKDLEASNNINDTGMLFLKKINDHVRSIESTEDYKWFEHSIMVACHDKLKAKAKMSSNIALTLTGIFGILTAFQYLLFIDGGNFYYVLFSAAFTIFNFFNFSSKSNIISQYSSNHERDIKKVRTNASFSPIIKQFEHEDKLVKAEYDLYFKHLNGKSDLKNIEKTIVEYALYWFEQIDSKIDGSMFNSSNIKWSQRALQFEICNIDNPLFGTKYGKNIISEIEKSPDKFKRFNKFVEFGGYTCPSCKKGTKKYANRKLIGTFYIHENQDGSPDKRFTDNPEHYVYNYSVKCYHCKDNFGFKYSGTDYDGDEYPDDAWSEI